MSEAFMGEVRLFGFNYPPQNWMICAGQLLPIRQYTALFSILGTNFGGDGRTTFGLPNFQAMVPVGAGTPTWGTSYAVGQTGGVVGVTINQATSPSHSHAWQGAGARYAADSNVPGPTKSLAPAAGCTPYVPASVNPPATPMNSNMLSPFGNPSPQPHNNLMPNLVVNFCICVNGIFPPRG